MQYGHEHAAWTSVMDMRLEMQRGNVAGICSKDLRDKFKDMQHGYGIKDIRCSVGCSIDMGMQHADSAEKCSEDMQHRSTVWACSMYIHVARTCNMNMPYRYVYAWTQHGHAVWKSAWMQLGHAALKSTLDMQQGPAA
jgi:hypothetical protein